MNETFEKVEQLTEHVKEYVNTRVEIAKLRLAEKTSLTVGNMIAAVVPFCDLIWQYCRRLGVERLDREKLCRVFNSSRFLFIGGNYCLVCQGQADTFSCNECNSKDVA
jgi:hypothetical protein